MIKQKIPIQYKVVNLFQTLDLVMLVCSFLDDAFGCYQKVEVELAAETNLHFPTRFSRHLADMTGR